jgi:hypothetical protein
MSARRARAFGRRTSRLSPSPNASASRRAVSGEVNAADRAPGPERRAGLLVLIIIAASIKGVISVATMALVIASLAWMYPTRTIRSQV